MRNDGSAQAPQAALLSNLALKVNIKLRGMNHRVAAPESNVSTSAFIDIAADTIVVGADVTHPSGSMAFSPSIAAVVASDDGDFANFPGSMRLQAGTQEVNLMSLRNMLTSADIF